VVGHRHIRLNARVDGTVEGSIDNDGEEFFGRAWTAVHSRSGSMHVDPDAGRVWRVAANLTGRALIGTPVRERIRNRLTAEPVVLTFAAMPFEEVVPGVTGFLTDRHIRAALEAGYLIERGSWAPDQIRHASYTIRLGHRVELERNLGGSADREQRKVTLTNGGPPLELRPGDTALLYSLENLRLPPSVLGFTVARGLLVVESLVPENTYIDPGFSGQIYTTVTNLSGRIIKIPYGTPIARLFFFRLQEDVEYPYQSGPAIGIPQHFDSTPGIAFPSAADARKASGTALYSDLIVTERGGARTAALLKRNAALGRVALMTAVLWPIALQIAMNWTWLNASAGVWMAGILTSMIATGLIWVLERAWRHLSEAG
jgi:deoxycytidine triphosphate deaminase